MAEVKTTNAVNVIEVVQAGPRGPIWSGEFSGSGNFTGSIAITGSLTVSGSGTLLNIGPFNNTGSIESSGSLVIDGSGSFTHVSASGDIHAIGVVSASAADIGSVTLGTVRDKNNPTSQYINWFTDEFRIYTTAGDKFGLSSTMANFKVPLTASAVSSSGDIIANQFTGNTIGIHTGNVVGNVIGDSTGLTGAPDIAVSALDTTEITSSGNLLFDGVNPTIYSNTFFDFRFHKVAGGADYFKISNDITSKELFKIDELGIMYLGQVGVDANITSEENMTFMIDYPGNNSTGLKFKWNNYTTTLMELSEAGDLDVQSGVITTSGNISASAAGQVIAETGSFSHINRIEDNDTYIDLGADRMDFICGGSTFVSYTEATTDKITLGTTGNNADITATAAGSFNKFFIDGDNGRVAINTGTVTDAQFTVVGDISGSGDLVVDQNLKIQGSEVDFTNLPVGNPNVLGRLFIEEALAPGTSQIVKVSGG